MEESDADDECFAVPSAELLASLQDRYDNFVQGLPVQADAHTPAEDISAEDTPACHKFRRRWNSSPSALPLSSQPEPASSPGKSSWDVVCIDDGEDETLTNQVQGGTGSSRPFQLMPTGSTQPRPSLRHLSKASPWSPSPGSPFQLGCSGRASSPCPEYGGSFLPSAARISGSAHSAWLFFDPRAAENRCQLSRRRQHTPLTLRTQSQ